MNIERYTALQKFLCCGAANPKMHNKTKKYLTIRHSCREKRREPSVSTPISTEPCWNMGITAIATRVPIGAELRVGRSRIKGLATEPALSGSILADWLPILMRDSHAAAPVGLNIKSPFQLKKPERPTAPMVDASSRTRGLDRPVAGAFRFLLPIWEFASLDWRRREEDASGVARSTSERLIARSCASGDSLNAPGRRRSWTSLRPGFVTKL
jgi:hypothetical protein